MSDDEEISIDFSKIKRFFKKALEDDEDKETKKEEKPEQKEQVQETSKEPEPKQENQPKAEGSEPEKPKESEPKVQETLQKESPKETPKQEDEEISFDFSKIKNIFKKSVKSSEKDEPESEDLKQITDSIKSGYQFVKKSSWVIPLLLLIIAMSFSVYIRMQSDILPITDDWAKTNVENTIKSQIQSKIGQEYPNLPADRKAELVNKELENFKKEYKADIENNVEALSNQFKEKLRKDIYDSEGNKIGEQTYLLAIDPYFWMRHTQNILDHGHVGDELRDGRPYNNHMYAPKGRFVPKDVFHAYFAAYLYKFMSFFNKDIDLMALMFYIPILISALAVIPAFFITRRIGGNFGGFVAGFIIAVHASFLTRTMGGFSDTDAYNVTFPLFITWFFLMAFEEKDLKKKLLFSGLSGLLIGIYSVSWSGWWYIFYLIIGSAGVFLIYQIAAHLLKSQDINKLIKSKSVQNTILLIIAFIFFSGVFITFIANFQEFSTVISRPMRFATLKDVGTKSVWPNVYTTVAEQNESSLKQVISNMGGRLLFALSITGIILAVFRKDNKGNYDIKYSILLVLWFLITIYASIKGVRFLLLLVPAFSIAFGLALGIIYEYLSKYISKELKVNKTLTKTVIIILLCVLLLGPWKTAEATAKHDIPSMTDAWYTSLEKIKHNSEPDAIITSWWDFGHWFKMIADRPVTFDGTSQGTPMAHWVGKSLLTPDEEISVGILRMLDCRSNDAFVELDKIIEKPYKSIEILYEIIVLDKDQAREKLIGYGLDDEQVSNILDKTHCQPPEAFFITSDDMIGKSGVWGHFGSWDFEKATIFNKVQTSGKEESIKFMIDEFNYTRDSAESTYSKIQSLGVGRKANDWIAGWPGYASSPKNCRKNTDEIYTCTIGKDVAATLNATTMDLSFSTSEGIKHPDKVVYINETDIIEDNYNDKLGIGVVIIPTKEGFSIMSTSPEQANSMFTKLYFFDGHGLTHFEKFSEEKSAIGQRIVIWKVDWEGTQENIFPLFIPEEKPEETPESLDENVTEEINQEANITEPEQSTEDSSIEEQNQTDINPEEQNQTAIKENSTSVSNSA